MACYQKNFRLSAHPRGLHIITSEITSQFPEIAQIEKGLLHIFIQHTSAALTINENADPTVRSDFEKHIDKLVPEDLPYYEHNYEGSDDMPAHIKSSLMSSGLSIPITDGRLNLGTWQGIYLCEFRNNGGPRRLLLTAMGE